MAALEPSFTASLWAGIAPIYEETLRHPFLIGLSDGSLPEAKFRHYVVQDSHYLRDFARALSILAAKAPTEDAFTLLLGHATNAITVERALHESFYTGWGLSQADVWATAPSPSNLLYSSYLLRVVQSQCFAEGLAAVLPCYWVYWEVGKVLETRGSPNPLYQTWIDAYASKSFATVVMEMLTLTEASAASSNDAQREQMRAIFTLATRMEYLFWDAAWREEGWPV
jgi:thiaminase (transcriptional activator TenA)